MSIKYSNNRTTRTGVTDAIGYQLWVLFEEAGVERARSAALGPRFYDGLAEAAGDNFVWKRGIIICVVWGLGPFFATILFQIRFSK